jgi:hypothetical protein
VFSRPSWSVDFDQAFWRATSAAGACGEDDVVRALYCLPQGARLRDVSGNHLDGLAKVVLRPTGVAGQDTHAITAPAEEARDQQTGASCASDNQDPFARSHAVAPIAP